MIDLCDPAAIRPLLDRYGFHFTKSLGQNFLVSRPVLERIADAAQLDRDTGVLEIGPGIGTLTAALAMRAKYVTAIEIDGALFPILAETLGEFQNITLVHADALACNLSALCAAMDVSSLCVCANLPYGITTTAVERLLASGLFGQITLLLQYDAVRRLMAEPGEEGCCEASVLVRHYAQPELLFRVPADSFLPRPNVDSAVLRMTVRTRTLSDTQETLYLRIVRAAFSQRRKTLANTMANAGIISRDDCSRMLENLGFSRSIRGEALSADDFSLLTNYLSEHTEV